MVDQIVGLLLLGLGVKNPYVSSLPAVKGDETVATATAVRATTVNAVRVSARDLVNDQQTFISSLSAARSASQSEWLKAQSQFTTKLNTIADARKRALLQKLNTNCQAINQKRTDAMTVMLTKLSQILANVVNRAATVKADVSSVDSAVAAAKSAITDAQTAVSAQAAKQCVLTFASERSMKADVGKVISNLQSELRAVQKKVTDARTAVGNAIRALAAVSGESL